MTSSREDLADTGADEPGWIGEALREHAEHERHEVDAGGRRQLPLADREQQVLDRIDRARRRRPRDREERITMSHGAGGKATQTLIEAIFLDAFRNPLLEPLEDAAQLRVDGSPIAFTTDSYVVSPRFFPGGNIGDLAVNGTVNDLSVAGARPLYLSAGFILEEGFPVADPKACQCGEVLKGVLKPWECKVFGTACTPETPIGTCMVSPEGACAAYYNYGRMNRERVPEASRS